MTARIATLLLALALLAGCGKAVGTDAGGGGPASPLPTGAPPADLTGFQVVAVTAAAGVTWALGTGPCTATCTAVARSTDGGRTWTAVAAPAAHVPGHGLLTSRLPVPGLVRWIRFGTARDGWAFGGGLWATHDGGASWDQVPTGGLEVLDLAAAGDRAYAVLAECGDDTGADCVRPRLVSTAAGAEGLTDLAPLPTDRVEHARVSAAGGLVVASVDDSIYTSAGGGWVGSAPCSLLAATAAADGRTIVAGCIEPALGARYVSLVRSTDGVHWDRPRGPSPRLTDGVLALAAAGPDDVVIGWSGTQQDGGLVRTADGGRTWTRPAAGEPDQWWVDVTAAGPRELLAVPYPDTDRFFTSADRGRTWRPVVVG